MYHRNRLIAIYNQIGNNHFDKIKKGEIMKKGSSSAIAVIVIVVLVIIIGTAIYFSNKNTTNNSNNSNTTQENTNGKVNGTTSTETREIVSSPDADIMIFYGATCPHCKVVNEFVIENNIDKVVKLQHLEVYNDKGNLELMKQKLEQCKNLSEDDKGGVPFMYSPETCLVGDKPIIDYLKEQAGA